MIKRLLLLSILFSLVSLTKASIRLKVGETETLNIGYISQLQGCQWTISRPDDVVFLSTPQSYSTQVTIKAVHGFPSTSPCIVQCKYYYLEADPTTGRYIYSRTGYKDWYIYVDEVKPNSISIYPTDVTFNINESRYLTATIYPSDASDDVLTWNVYGSGVISYSKINNNKISILAIGSGDASVIVKTSNGLEATCKVKVSKIEPTGVSLSPQNMSLSVGDTKRLTATLTPTYAETTLKWSSNDKKIANVTSAGYVEGIGQGKTKITVTTANGYSASCDVTVTPQPDSISIPEFLSLKIGTNKSLIPVLYPANSTSTYTWSSNNNKIATVSTAGVVTGVAVGTTQIKVSTSNGKSAICKVEIKDHEQPEKIKLNKNLIKLAEGYYFDLIPTVEPDDAVVTYAWTTSDKSVATVSSAGRVTAIKTGKAIITVNTQNDKSYTCEIQVVRPTDNMNALKVSPKVTHLKSLVTESLKQIITK